MVEEDQKEQGIKDVNENGDHGDDKGTPTDLIHDFDEVNEESFIYPLPLKVNPKSNEDIGVNSTPAFQCLEELFAAGKLPGSRVAFLKAKYQQLVDLLSNTREAESHYLHEAKELTQISQKQQATIDQGEVFPSNEDTEVNRLRIECLKHGNELEACNERVYQLNYKMEALREERDILEKELKRLPKQEEIDKKFKESKEEVDTLKVEISQKTLEMKDLSEEVISQCEQAGKFSKIIETLEKEEADLKEELVKIHGEPTHISKQSDLITRQQRDVAERLKLFEAQNTELNEELEKVLEKRKGVAEEHELLTKTIELERGRQADKEKEVSLLDKECELAKERQAELLCTSMFNT